MEKKTKTTRRLWLMIFSLSLVFKANAQLSLTGQLRTRTEYRDGLGTLRAKTSDPAFFTSQRTRLTFQYRQSRLIFQTSVQDIRVWGQDASTISNADGNKLGVHEAWAEIILSNKKDSSLRRSAIDYLGIKIGRQEFLYDDSRLLGNLDWLQQARRHDAVVVKLINKGWQADAGFAFNQNTDAFNYNGTYYTPANVSPYIKDSKGNLLATPPGLIPIVGALGYSAKTGSLSMINAPGTNAIGQQYKSLQYLYLARNFGQTRISWLTLADEFSKYKIDSVPNIAGTDTGYVYGRRYTQKGVNARVTTGLLVNAILDKQKRFTATAGFYYQTGKDKEGLRLSAFSSTASLSFTKNKFSYTAGWDYVSGNDAFSSSSVNHRFDPLYGTPHKFWGTMDYFYVATGSPAGGLSNPFFKIRYTTSGKQFTAGLDYHYFSLARNMKDAGGNAIDKYLGSEFDLLLSYNLNKITNLEWGFSYMAASRSMEYAKAIAPGSSQLCNTWIYLQVNIRPEFLIK